MQRRCRRRRCRCPRCRRRAPGRADRTSVVCVVSTSRPCAANRPRCCAQTSGAGGTKRICRRRGRHRLVAATSTKQNEFHYSAMLALVNRPEALSSEAAHGAAQEAAGSRRDTRRGVPAVLAARVRGDDGRRHAREAGVSPGNVYIYFRSKLEILYAIYDPWLRARVEALERRARRHRSPRGRLRRLLIALWRDIPAEENGFLNNIMQAISVSDPAKATGRRSCGGSRSAIDGMIDGRAARRAPRATLEGAPRARADHGVRRFRDRLSPASRVRARAGRRSSRCCTC